MERILNNLNSTDLIQKFVGGEGYFSSDSKKLFMKQENIFCSNKALWLSEILEFKHHGVSIFTIEPLLLKY